MSSVSFTIVKPYKNKLVAMNKRQEKEMKKENENFKKSTKKTKKNKTKRIERITPSWELLLESAIRAEQIGRLGIEVYGRFYSAKEIEEKCRHFHPLPPFTVMREKS